MLLAYKSHNQSEVQYSLVNTMSTLVRNLVIVQYLGFSYLFMEMNCVNLIIWNQHKKFTKKHLLYKWSVKNILFYPQQICFVRYLRWIVIKDIIKNVKTYQTGGGGRTLGKPYCQAQPHLQLQIWLRLVLFFNLFSHPPTPTQDQKSNLTPYRLHLDYIN